MTISKKQQFEELIDAMMIEEVAGLDTELKLKLQGLPLVQKRIGILSILDKDRGLFMKILEKINGQDVNTVEHIQNVVEMLREYVEVGVREQKEFGEVFTKYWTISEMLDLIPEEDWSNPNLKFLDSCAGAGNFPAVIIQRLMNGLAEWEPNEEKRYRHIIENMIYMAELQPKNAFLILCALDPKDTYDLNIFNGSFLSEEFDNHKEDVWGVDNFDYVIQNPPYQELVNGNNRMKTLYNVFIDKALLITNKLISIHPSRWMAGGFGLDDFRDTMFKRTDIKIIKHWDDSQFVFGKVVEIKGGVQYFFIDKSYNGLVEYNGEECNINEFDVFVEPKYRGLVNRFKSFNSLKEICKSKSFWMNFNDKELSDTKNDDNLLCYVSQNKGLIKYLNKDLLTKNALNVLGKYKVFTPYASGSTGNLGYFGNKIIGLPNETCSNTYMTFLVNNKIEAQSLVTYMNTSFCKFFLSLRKNTQNMKPDTSKWIPMVPFDREWTDELVFEYFGLTKEEQNLILKK